MYYSVLDVVFCVTFKSAPNEAGCVWSDTTKSSKKLQKNRIAQIIQKNTHTTVTSIQILK